jgi:ABC-2 type transport system permease protein
MTFWLAAATLARREIVRFLRQRNRIVGALGTPIVFWLLLGSGLGASFRQRTAASSEGYLQYFFPGAIALIVLFTAIFATISIIEDRQAGFLQSVLVAPVPRSAIVLGKVAGGAALALVQSMLLVAASPALGIALTAGKIAALAGVLAVAGLALSALGFLIAWRLDSTQGFHAIMNLFLMPMWMLSGAFFPAAGAPAWLRVLVALNPLTYPVAALRRILYLGPAAVDGVPSLQAALTVTLLFGAAAFAATTWVASRPATR